MQIDARVKAAAESPDFSGWNTIDIATAYAQWVAWRDAFGDIKRLESLLADARRDEVIEQCAVAVEEMGKGDYERAAAVVRDMKSTSRQ